MTAEMAYNSRPQHMCAAHARPNFVNLTAQRLFAHHKKCFAVAEKTCSNLLEIDLCSR